MYSCAFACSEPLRLLMVSSHLSEMHYCISMEYSKQPRGRIQFKTSILPRSNFLIIADNGKNGEVSLSWTQCAVFVHFSTQDHRLHIPLLTLAGVTLLNLSWNITKCFCSTLVPSHVSNAEYIPPVPLHIVILILFSLNCLLSPFPPSPPTGNTSLLFFLISMSQLPSSDTQRPARCRESHC